MPELPEVETIKRELERAVKGKRIVGVIINRGSVIKEPSRKKFTDGIKGVVVKRILRKGKLLILELSNHHSLTVHLRMTGQLVYPGEPEKSRVSFKLSNGKFLDYRDSRVLGELRLVSDWENMKFVKDLGPEPFDMSAKDFQLALAGKKTKIKPLLLDQKFISGVGNLYAAEALFRAKIHPEQNANKLTAGESRRLFLAIKHVLTSAIRHHGSSVDQYVQLTGRPGDFVRFHKVYDRAGKPCFVCGANVKRISLGGRGTYFCPKCQKRG